MDDKAFKEYYEIERLRYCMGVVADWLNEHREYEIVEGEYRGTREFAIQTKCSPTMAEIEAIYPCLPSAERRGRWFIKKDVTFPHMVCSECKKPFYGNMNDTWNYCPYCGARMMD